MKYVKIILYVFIILILSSCSVHKEEPLKISISNWIGYSPILYSYEKNWLQKEKIKIVTVVSLSENLTLFKAFNSDGFTGTQFEYKIANDKFDSLIPLILLDKSNGGDVIMGNMAIDQYKHVEKIDTYLEIDSVNSILLESFLEKHGIDKNKINYINKDQSYISNIKNSENLNPTLLITYNPYNIYLEKNGFLQLDSTKDDSDLLIIDALFVQKEKYLEHKEQFSNLKIYIDKAIEDLERNPLEYYETIKKYYSDMSYEDFIDSLNDINWINKNLDENIVKKLNEKNFPIRDILK